jgi:hypothetical protein
MAVEAYYIVAGIIGTAQTSKISLPVGSRGQEPAFQVKKSILPLSMSSLARTDSVGQILPIPPKKLSRP